MSKRQKTTKEKKGRGRGKKIGISLAILLIICAAGGIILWRLGLFSKDQDSSAAWQNQNQGSMNSSDFSNMISASGTTSISMTNEVFSVEGLSAALTVEEVYISSGDTVEAGDPLLKVTDDSVEEALAELEDTLTEADLALRAGAITYAQSQITAKYTYDSTTLEAQQAEAVYQASLAELEAQLASAKESYEEAQTQIAQYQADLSGDTYVDTYSVSDAKAAYEAAEAALAEAMAAGNITEEEIEAYLSSQDTEEQGNTQGFSPMSATTETLEGSSEEQQEGNMPGAEVETETEAATEAETNAALEEAAQLYQEAETLKAAYESAQEGYQQAVSNAESQITTLTASLPTLAQSYVEMQEEYETQLISLQVEYETAVAKGTLAQSDYDAALSTAEETYQALEDAYTEAQEALDTFNALVQDGVLYAAQSGTVLRTGVTAGGTISTDSVLVSYRDSSTVSVVVSVDQSDIAQIAVGDSATVIIGSTSQYTGTVATINPVTSSTSKTSVTYEVTVTLENQEEALSENTTATVYFSSQGDAS